MTEIRLEHIDKNYKDKIVLKDFSATFPEGSVTCIMGPSGCGKTTVLRLILGLEKQSAGSISGVPSRTSVVFQEDRLCEDFSAFTNILMCVDSKMDTTGIMEDLEAVGLKESAMLPVRELSGGMKRRVAIVRAMCAPGDLIVMDEPLSGLDEENKRNVIAYIKDKSIGKTMLIVTHDKAEAEIFDGELLLME